MQIVSLQPIIRSDICNPLLYLIARSLCTQSILKGLWDLFSNYHNMQIRCLSDFLYSPRSLSSPPPWPLLGCRDGSSRTSGGELGQRRRRGLGFDRPAWRNHQASRRSERTLGRSGEGKTRGSTLQRRKSRQSQRRPILALGTRSYAKTVREGLEVAAREDLESDGKKVLVKWDWGGIKTHSESRLWQRICCLDGWKLSKNWRTGENWHYGGIFEEDLELLLPC